MVPYQGSKWKFRKALAAVLASEGYTGSPARALLVDPGPFGLVHSCNLRDVAIALEDMAAPSTDPGLLYAGLHGHSVHSDPPRAAAEFMLLQRLAFSGKAVQWQSDGRAMRWRSPGLNITSAYGLPATDKFGAVRPQLPGLPDHLRGLSAAAAGRVTGVCAAFRRDMVLNCRRAVVYIDPPYEGTSGYGDEYPREQVLDDATYLRAAGHLVVVSEAVPLDVHGADHVQLAGPSGSGSPFKSKKPEWLTILRPL